MVVLVNDATKFKLLLWKNSRLIWRQKMQLACQILIPSVFMLVVFIVRILFDPHEIKEEIVYPYINLTLDILRSKEPTAKIKVNQWNLAYSPQNPLLEEIVSRASKDLGLEGAIRLTNAMLLDNHLVQYGTLAGIEFEDKLIFATELPKEIIYAIRLPSEQRLHNEPFHLSTWETRNLFDVAHFGGPRSPQLETGGYPDYISEGFAAIQNAISLNIIRSLSGSKSFPELQMSRMPVAPHVYDTITHIYINVLGLLILLSFMYTAGLNARYIANEKELQLREIMKIMGVRNTLHWLAWFIIAYCLMILSVIFLLIMLKIPVNKGFAVLPNTDFSVLLFFFAAYCLVSISFFFMIGTFFGKASTANFASSFLWFLGYFPFQFIEANYDSVSDIVKYTVCLIPNSALCIAFKLILKLEASGQGFQWKNLASPTNADDNLHISRIMIIMVVATFIEILLTLYFEKVHPGPYGVPEKWYFPFKKRFWVKKRRNIEEEDRREAFMELYGEFEERDENKFEPDPPHKRIGVLIRRLWKIYGKRVAVKNLSVNLFKNEITILLGHNGAGKTSTISMLTGMIPPTKGTAILNGFDIRTNLHEARQSLGLCPQYNILFDELTVREHIIFYSRLKGLDSNSINSEVAKYVKILNLERKIDKRSETLSGGMKRKLSVASALCGDSKVVLLDEPSSGMDPAARRALWDIIQNEKKNRTILLSTHFMEEAEALGDRIAIMQGGVLECFGTSYFLKKKFGCGYHLICIKRPDCDTNKITELLAKYIPEIDVESNIGTELSYRLPDAYAKNFETILSQIETKANDLNLDGYGISLTTLEDVFMTVGADYAVTTNVEDETPKITDGGTFYHDEQGKPIKLLKGIYLRLSQWRAILLKKALCVRRGYKMYLISWSLAILIILLTMYQTILYQSLKPMGSLLFSMADYHESISPLEVELTNLDGPTQDLQKEYLEITTSFGKAHKFTVFDRNFTGLMNYNLLKVGKKNMVEYKEKYLIGASILPYMLVAWFSNEPLHCIPLSLNTLHNAMARTIDPAYSIQVINKPLPYQKETELADAQSGFNFGFMLACNVCLALSFLSGLYIILPVKEKENRAKLLQFVCGCKASIFWFGCYIIDFITLCITMLIMVLVLSTFNQSGFRTFKELARLFLIFVLYGLAILPLNYLISCGLRRSASAYAKISIINLITGIIPFFLTYILNALGTIHNLHVINLFLFVLPHYNLAIALVNLYTIGTTTQICTDICERYLYVNGPEYNCSFLFLCTTLNITQCCTKTFFDSDSPGCLFNLIYYAVETAIFFCILLLVEERVFDKVYYKLYPPNRVPESIFYGDKTFQDGDVVEEERKIRQMGASEIKRENLIIFGLSKYYKKFVAVNNLYLQVKNAECFGLLGVNGAGKTSTFKVLTGDTKINYGAVFVRGISITENMRSVYRRIGYCPQFDALLEDLTGREVMKVFCLLRGIPSDKIYRTTYKLSLAFGFNIHLDKKVKNYSGGNKRKLSTSIALLGNPVIIYLDEPTTGMDPGARRQLWDVICKVRDSGKAIVLTSHSMEECEALCTRLAIMVNGEFKCIGSIQHLKNKFSKGLVLKIKLKFEDTEFFKSKSNLSLISVVQSQEFINRVTNVQAFIESEFPNSILKEKFQQVLTFHVIMEQVQWSKIFGIMEKNKERLNIEDYSINQTTLESIFLEFAKSQSVDNRNYK